MNKQERLDRIKELVEGETTYQLEEIAKLVSEEAKVSVITVMKDLKENHPDLFEDDDSNKPTVIKIKLSEEEKENKELRKGRLTEYEVPENEMNDVHVEIEKTNMKMNGNSLKKVSVPCVQKFNVRGAWDQFRRNANMLGFSHVRVLYAPEGVETEVIVPANNPNKKK